MVRLGVDILQPLLLVPMTLEELLMINLQFIFQALMDQRNPLQLL